MGGQSMKVLKPLRIAVFLACAPCFFGQDQSHPAKENSLYAKALFASVAQMDKQWSRYSRGDENTADTDYHHMPVQVDPPEITDGLPTESGEYHVEYLDPKAQKERFQRLRKRYAILKIDPVQDEGSQLKIVVSVSYVSRRKKAFVYEFSDWSDVKFRFDCEKQEFVISSIELGGI